MSTATTTVPRSASCYGSNISSVGISPYGSTIGSPSVGIFPFGSTIGSPSPYGSDISSTSTAGGTGLTTNMINFQRLKRVIGDGVQPQRRHALCPHVPLTLNPLAPSAVMKAISGTWWGEEGETYTFLFPESLRWRCLRSDSKGSGVVEVSFDEELGLVWWGESRALYMSGAEVLAEGHCIRWYAARDAWAQAPSCVWTRQEAPDCQAQLAELAGAIFAAQHAEPAGARFADTAARATVEARHAEPAGARFADAAAQAQYAEPAGACVADAAVRATAEVMRQIVEQGGKGKVQLPDWGERYGEQLGPLRAFIASQPDKFIIVMTRNARRYSVAVVEPSASSELKTTRGSLAELAVSEVMKQVSSRGEACNVSVPDWKETFSPHLGTLRSFLESRPEIVVIPRTGNKFIVAAAAASSAAGVAPGEGGWPPCAGTNDVPVQRLGRYTL